MKPCRQTRELLPWYVNGTLDATGRETVEFHLASCGDCRQELEETRIALAVATQHLPTEVLVAYVAGDETVIDPELLESHLASCADCAEELARLRESHDALLGEPVEDPLKGPEGEPDVDSGEGNDDSKVLSWPSQNAKTDGNVSTWRRVAAVAALLALVSGYATFNMYRESARLAERVAELDGPEVNVTLVDLYPDDLVLRGETSDEAPAEVPPTAERVTLILNSRQAPSSGPFRIELRDPDTGTVSVIEGLKTDADGLLILSLGADALGGERVLMLFDAGSSSSEPVEAYRIRR